MITTDITADLVRGISELEETPRGLTPHRLPGWVRKQYPDPQLLSMEVQPSGVRLTFTTEATQMALETHPSRVVYRGADRPRGCLQVLIDDQP